MAGLGLDFIDMCLGKGVNSDDISGNPYRVEQKARARLVKRDYF